MLREGSNVAGESFGIAAEKDDFAGAAIAQFLKPASELLRRELLAGSVKENGGCAGLDFQLATGCGRGVAKLGDFDFGEMADAGEVIVKQGANFLAARFTEHNEADFHSLNEAVFLALIEQGLAADAENFRSFADFVVNCVQGGGDGLALEFFKGF